MSYTRSTLRGAKNKADQKVSKSKAGQILSAKGSTENTARILNGMPAYIEEFPFTV